jgi:hypothetical protein
LTVLLFSGGLLDRFRDKLDESAGSSDWIVELVEFT